MNDHDNKEVCGFTQRFRIQIYGWPYIDNDTKVAFNIDSENGKETRGGSSPSPILKFKRKL